jgi:hypothetical protein
VRQHVVRIALGLVVVALFVGYAAQFYRVDFVNRFDHLLYDTRLRLTAPGGSDDRIVILDIDERSLATPELGRWPWGKGKDEPVAIFEPIGPENEVGRERVEELKLWGQALKLYRARSWDQAELILFNLQRLYPRVPLYSLYADRVARYRHESPGPGWDGVTSFETK